MTTRDVAARASPTRHTAEVRRDPPRQVQAGTRSTGAPCTAAGGALTGGVALLTAVKTHVPRDFLHIDVYPGDTNIISYRHLHTGVLSDQKLNSSRLASGLALRFLVPLREGEKVRHPGTSPSVHGQRRGLCRLHGEDCPLQIFAGATAGSELPLAGMWPRSVTQTGLDGWGTENKEQPPPGLSLGALGAVTFRE
ncbi:unnamed protein product [Rangifer tarandus platyrhynchus]|uniref:Uncharacterized protein n=1 Tax=Rangifer tarandus platyrhynchus TaxID=3082113 RepID=A0AC59ZRU5_RANTA